MDCIEDSICFSFLPKLPPPPPLPSFLSEDVENFLNQSKGLVGGGSESWCDLCSWAGAEAGYGDAKEMEDNNSLPISSLLVIVAVVSALVGAGLTASILSFRRLRNRKFEEGTGGSVRHLSRKINESSRPTPSSSSFTSTAFTENTYCEGPYNDKEPASNNIYAELHPGIQIQTGMWSRPPIHRPPIPAPIQNCYLELKDLPNRCGRCLPVPPLHQWQSNIAEDSPSSSAYYSDLELARHSAQPV